MNRKAVFLDKDGVLNEPVLREGKVSSPRNLSEFKLIPNAQKALHSVKNLGYLIIVATNQPDVSRGLLRREDLDTMLAAVMESSPIDDMIVCVHDDADACDCRKPKPGMLLTAAKKWDIDLAGSYFIGDGLKDAQAAEDAGCRFILIDKPYNHEVRCRYHAKDLSAACEQIADFQTRTA
ncbi:MAG: HAD-IIIA family hydrolase [Elusimicrobiota bacterium]